MRILGVACAACLLLGITESAQKPTKKSPPTQAQAKSPTEDEVLAESLQEAGSSAVEYARALERHLRKYPNSEKKDEIVRVLAQAALEQKDYRRLLLYGIPVLDEGNANLALMDYVCRALLARGTKEDAEKALGYARRMSAGTIEQRKQFEEDKAFRSSRARRLEELDAAMGRALWHESRALKIMGDGGAALEAINKSWTAAPLEETARERSAQLEAAGRKEEAASAWVDAITTGGLDLTDAADRQRLQALAGDRAGRVLLDGWARAESRNKEREARFKAADPNFGAKKILDYTLSATQGEPLPLKSLRGKVVVIDFWATWCGPCRAQHPLYEEVKKKFAGRNDVAFLSISTDEHREAVAPFLETMNWSKLAYFDDGLAVSQRISSIPTTMILDKEGEIASRLHGFSADRFVNMLTDRIKEALGEGQ